MNVRLSSQIETWDEMIRSGRGQEVARALNRLSREDVDDLHLGAVANLAWRVGTPQVGLRLAYPYMQRCYQLKIPYDPQTQTEFAGCLLEIGATAEALRLLREVESSSPRANFYRALLCFKEWDYAGAIPLLQNYLRSLPESYHQRVVRVNLASALVVAEHFEEAQKLIEPLKQQLAENKEWLLFGNLQEIQSQIHFAQGDYQSALRLLSEGEVHLASARNMGWLYLKKWQLINRLMSSSSQKADRFQAEYTELKALALSMASWETARELDTHWALARQDETLLTKLEFGSPAPLYRERLHRLTERWGMKFNPKDSFLYSQGLRANKLIPIENLIYKKKTSDSPHAMLPKRLLLILSSDFYAPFRMGQLYSLLFEGAHYNPDSSPDKVFQIVRSLRRQLATQDQSLSLTSSLKGYRLEMKPDVGLLITRPWLNRMSMGRTDIYATIARQIFGSESFSTGQISEAFGVSPRTANRIASALAESEQLVGSGQGKGRRYRLAA